MQRITRVKYDKNSDQKYRLDEYNQILTLLQPHLTDHIFLLLAKPRLIDNDNYIGWYSDIEGQPILFDEIRDKDQQKAVKQRLNDALQDIENSVKMRSFTPEQQTLINEWLPRIKSSGNRIFVINGDPVIVNTFEPPILPPSSPVPSKPFWNGFRLALLALLLLALLALLWYLFCPWGKAPKVESVVTKPQPIAVIPPVPAPQPEPAPQLEPVPEPTPEPIPEPMPEPVKEAPKPKVKNDPNCITQEEIKKDRNPSKMVMVFDNSNSMNLSLLESPESIKAFQSLDKDVDLRALNIYTPAQGEAYLKKMLRKPNRLSESKKVALTSIDKIQPNIDIALVTLSRCPSAEVSPFYNSAKRSTLKNKINMLTPYSDGTSSTPLYSGIEQASQLLDGVTHDDYILVISDGEDNCSRNNICTLANSIAAQKPRLKINIVDIAGQHKIDCVATMTGGKVYIAQSPNELIKQMNSAVKSMKISRPMCK